MKSLRQPSTLLSLGNRTSNGFWMGAKLLSRALQVAVSFLTGKFKQGTG
jgi:hypothetical protein